MAGVSPGSDTLKLAGEHGFLPMSLNLNQSYVASHWASVEEGARRVGKTPSRADWRLVREIFVIGNEPTGLWKKALGLAAPDEVIKVAMTVVDDRGEDVHPARPPGITP